MAYVVNLKRLAEKELERLPAKIHDRIIECLISLKEYPRPAGVKKLRGRDIPFTFYLVLIADHESILIRLSPAGRTYSSISAP